MRSRRIKLVRLVLAGGAAGALLSVIPAAAMAAAPAAQAATAPTKFPYTFTNYDGSTTVIPSEPKRVVVLDSELDAITTLGVRPVGFQGVNGQKVTDGQNGYDQAGLPEFINGGELNGIQSFPAAFGAPNLEGIAALHPDLIIGAKPAYLAQLQQIAPTILVPPSSQTATANPDPTQFDWENEVTQLAPIFNATARAAAVIARIHQRAATLAELVHGQSVAVLLMLGGQNLILLGAYPNFAAAGVNLQDSLAGATNGGYQEFDGSAELLPSVTASKVLVEVNSPFGSVDEAGFKAFPLYSQMPAAQTNQVYFTNWFVNGPISDADQLTEYSEQMFGVTPLEATLSGAGKQSATHTGVADVDVGRAQTKTCWNVTTSGSIGKPNSMVIQTAKGKALVTLGKGFHDTGCVNLKPAIANTLASSPKKYTVAVRRTSVKHTKVHKRRKTITTTTTLLTGSLSVQSPAFFGNGKDTLYTPPPNP